MLDVEADNGTHCTLPWHCHSFALADDFSCNFIFKTFLQLGIMSRLAFAHKSWKVSDIMLMAMISLDCECVLRWPQRIPTPAPFYDEAFLWMSHPSACQLKSFPLFSWEKSERQSEGEVKLKSWLQPLTFSAPPDSQIIFLIFLSRVRQTRSYTPIHVYTQKIKENPK